MTLLSQAHFAALQTTFYKKCTGSPYSVTITQWSVTAVSDLRSFVGSSLRTPLKVITLPCLYEKIVNRRQREKYGLPETVDGIIFIAPLQLTNAFGTFQLNENTCTFQFEGRLQVINSVTYLESLYNSCIGVQFNIMDSLKGG